MPAARKTADPASAITYVRVSTEDQAASGLGLKAQRAKVRGEVARRGWRLVDEFADEGLSAKTIVGRPELLAALDALDDGRAGNLVVAKLDRLSRSVHDFTGLVERAQRRGWSLVVMDLGVDTSTPSGEMMANVLASFAQFERKLIGQRTSDALQAKRRQGAALGRPERASTALALRIANYRQDGATLAAIASVLNSESVPTPQGGARWYPSSVAAVLRRQAAAS